MGKLNIGRLALGAMLPVINTKHAYIKWI